LPDSQILLENRLRGTDKLLTTFVTSRGCPFSCRFCANINNGRIRYRSPENIRGEIEELLTVYPDLGGLLIMDETFTLKREHVLGVTDVIKDYDIQYVASSRADRITPEVANALVESGCLEVKFGIETGSQYLLNRMNKKGNIRKFIEGIKTASKSGLYTKLFLLHGYPGENQETTTQTIRMLEELKPYVRRIALYRFVPLPGSPVYSMVDEYDLHIDKDFSKFHIYHNTEHWWGTKRDHQIVREQFDRLEKAVISIYSGILSYEFIIVTGRITL
jgi:radical SAM superfamily enzyme YgiQ (UPF0313 family)